MRRQFLLPEADRLHLNARGLPWETLVEAGAQWLLVHGFPVPDRYNHTQVISAVMIPRGYADAPLDMVWFYPLLARRDGCAINGLSTQTIDGKVFQRWSRHRTSQNPWRPGEDDLAAHLALVEYWLARELIGG